MSTEQGGVMERRVAGQRRKRTHRIKLLPQTGMGAAFQGERQGGAKASR